MEGLFAQAQAFRDEFGATKTLITGNEVDSLLAWSKAMGGTQVIATPHPGAKKRFGDNLMPLGYRVGGGINGLRNLRDVILTAYVEGRISSQERLFVVQLGEGEGYAFMGMDMAADESVAKLRKDLEYRADLHVVEAVLQIARDLAREGREKNPVGALFVIGDADRVLQRSRQVVLNPFAGHPPQDRNVLDSRTHETFKEFCQIDGGIVVRGDGVAEAAGRYIDVHDPTDLPSGLGGRHLAAAAVTTDTKAIAITCSESGVVRIFRDGRILLRIGVT